MNDLFIYLRYKKRIKKSIAFPKFLTSGISSQKYLSNRNRYCIRDWGMLRYAPVYYEDHRDNLKINKPSQIRK